MLLKRVHKRHQLPIGLFFIGSMGIILLLGLLAKIISPKQPLISCGSASPTTYNQIAPLPVLKQQAADLNRQIWELGEP
jgi:hypothetical protein